MVLKFCFVLLSLKQPVSEPAADQTNSIWDPSLHVPEAKSFSCPNGYGPRSGKLFKLMIQNFVFIDSKTWIQFAMLCVHLRLCMPMLKVTIGQGTLGVFAQEAFEIGKQKKKQ